MQNHLQIILQPLYSRLDKIELQNLFNKFLCIKIVSVAPQIAVFLNLAFKVIFLDIDKFAFLSMYV